MAFIIRLVVFNAECHDDSNLLSSIDCMKPAIAASDCRSFVSFRYKDG